MTTVTLDIVEWYFKDNTVFVSEREVGFDTKYDVISPSGNHKVFNFTHSTGSEFSPETQWVYESEDGTKFAVCNDANMVRIAAKNYLKAKLRKG